MQIFRDRKEAGLQLGKRLRGLRLGKELFVLGLPRGGVPVALEVATALDAPLDVIVVRKLGARFNPELALGAVAFGGVTVYNEALLRDLGISEDDLEDTRSRELAELERRERAYRGARPMPDLAGKTVVLVDDGIATGATMLAAVSAIRALHPKRVIVAVPTSAVDSAARLEAVADRVIALATPEPYYGVGAWYAEFHQLDDAEVVRCLEAAAARRQPQNGSTSRESQARA
jgi:putative phosphoribosyl transferase